MAEKQVWKILLIDDDSDDYLITRDMLSAARGVTFDLQYAPSFVSGLEAVRSGSYDAVLVDYDLGSGTGLELIREAVALDREFPIILLTGRGSYEVDMEAMQAGATLYLTKTEANSLLLERVIRYAIELKQKEAALKEREAHLIEVRERLEQELTERVQVEKALRESEARLLGHDVEINRINAVLSGIIEGTGDIIAAIDLNMRYIALNSRYRMEFIEVFGREVAPGDSVEEALAHLPEDRVSAVALWQRALRGETFQITAEFGDPGLGRKVFEMRFGPIHDAAGQVVGAAETANDVTARVRAEDALRESERSARELAEVLTVERAKLAAAIDSLPVGVGIGDAQGNTLSMNSAGLALHGFSSQEEMFSRLESYIEEFELCFLDGRRMPVEDWPASRAMRGEFVTDYEVLVRNQVSGVERLIAYTTAPVRSSAGETILIVYVMQDLTERRRSEEALRQSEERFRVMANNISQLAWMMDDSGWIFWYNQRWFDYTGTTLEEMQGWGWQAVHHPDHLDRVVEKFKDSISRGEIWEDTFPLRGKDGQYRWFLSRAMPIHDESGRVARWFGTNTDITGEMELEAENRRQKEMLERIFETIPAGIAFLSGPDFVYTLVNEEYRRYASGKGELIGRTVAEKWAEVADVIIPQLERVYQSGEPFSIVDTALQIRHGDVIQDHFFSYTFTPLNDAEGRVEGIMILAIDTTASVRARQEIEVERARLNTVLQFLPVGVWIIDETGQALMVNERANQLWAGEAPMPKNYEEYNQYIGWYAETGEEIKGSDWPISQALIHNRQLHAVEVEIQRYDGTRATTLISATPVQNSAGQAIGAVAIMLDITDRKEIERDLRQSEATLRSNEAYLKQMVESLPGLVWTMDAEGHLDYLSPQWLAFTGTTLEGQLGSVADESIHPEDRARLLRAVQKAILKQEGFDTEYRVRRHDGEYCWFKASGTPIKDNEGRIVRWFGISMDIDQLKRAEEALTEYAGRLVQSNQDLQNFAFIASHDLQEPLRKIITFGDFVRRSMDGRLDVNARDHLDRMLRAAGRMQEMIRALLELSRVSTHGQEFRPVDLRQAAQEVVSDLDHLIQRTGGEVVVGDLPQIEADPVQIQQLLQNIIANGLKFHRGGEPPRVKVSSCLDDSAGEVTIRIEDNGVGFDPEHLDRILEPFQRLHGKTEYEGTGMGLAICKRIVERHKGRIAAESEPGNGSAFLVTLPVKQ